MAQSLHRRGTDAAPPPQTDQTLLNHHPGPDTTQDRLLLSSTEMCGESTHKGNQNKRAARWSQTREQFILTAFLPKQTPQGQEQVKHIQNFFTPIPGAQGLSKQDSCAFSSTPLFMAQWDCSTETVRGSAVGVSKFHRTASEEVKQAQMNALQKAA